MKSKKGFTLIEVIVVLIIVGVLAVLALTSLTSWIRKSTAAEGMLALSEAKNRIETCLAINQGQESLCSTVPLNNTSRFFLVFKLDNFYVSGLSVPEFIVNGSPRWNLAACDINGGPSTIDCVSLRRTGTTFNPVITCVGTGFYTGVC